MTPVCRVCGSSEAVRIGDTVASAPDTAVYRCGQCTLVYLFPIMSEKEEADFYWLQFEKYMKGRSAGGWRSPEEQFCPFQTETEPRLEVAGMVPVAAL